MPPCAVEISLLEPCPRSSVAVVLVLGNGAPCWSHLISESPGNKGQKKIVTRRTHISKYVSLSLVAACGFSSCGSWALEHRLSSYGGWAYLPQSMWDLPGVETEPMSPALAGRFFTTEPSGKPSMLGASKRSPTRGKGHEVKGSDMQRQDQP